MKNENLDFMKHSLAFLVNLLAFVFVNVNVMNADVLGPYLMSNVPSTPVGYDRVVFPLVDVSASVTASFVVCDESGKQYAIRTSEPGGAPNCYFMAIGTYRVVSFNNCVVQSSNWKDLKVGSSFEVNGKNGGYVNLKYTGVVPDMQSIIQAPGTDDNKPTSKPYYATMKVYGVNADGSGTLVDEKGKEYGVYNYTGHTGGAHYFYIFPGTYTVKRIGTNGNYIYLDINGIKSRLSDGMAFSVSGIGVNISIIFSKNLL